MKKFNNKSGFTLIEIIVVLIIVGILAAIALPNLFSNVKKTRAEEALATMSSWRPNMEACLEKYVGSEGNCALAGANAVAFPANTACFGYGAGTNVPSSGNPKYSILATGAACGLTGTDTLDMEVAAVGSAPTCVGAGNLAGAC